MRNDLTIYDRVADRWWSDDIRWVRTLKNLVPGRLAWFDRQIDWVGKTVLDLGCAGGFMAEALANRGANVTGIDPAAEAIDAARAHAREGKLRIGYDVGMGEALPYDDASFDAVVCVDVLEHVSDLHKVLAEVARTLRPGGLFLFDTINRNLLARLATITVAEDVLRLLPRGTHDPAMFIKPAELRAATQGAGLLPGPITGLGPRGINRRGDLTFGPLPLTAILYMGIAQKTRCRGGCHMNDLLRENVQSYPPPPALQPVPQRIIIRLRGVLVADTSRALRVLETHHAPTYYLPLPDIHATLRPAQGSSFCEWKGVARYFDVVAGSAAAPRAAWAYDTPTAPFAAIAGHVAFYAALLDEVWVGDLRVIPQPGNFYGGWVTPNLDGQIKGAPGTQHL